MNKRNNDVAIDVAVIDSCYLSLNSIAAYVLPLYKDANLDRIGIKEQKSEDGKFTRYTLSVRKTNLRAIGYFKNQYPCEIATDARKFAGKDDTYYESVKDDDGFEYIVPYTGFNFDE